jgi:dUTP pyrophosphatase
MPITDSSSLEICIKCFPHHEGLDLPRPQSDGSSGLDLRAAIDEEVILKPGDRALIPAGIAISIPDGFEGQVRPRSGLAIKHGIGLLNSPGTIDSDYRGEVKIILINLGQATFKVSRGLRIAQLVISRHTRVDFKIVDDLDVTTRNEGGFGHTGV